MVITACLMFFLYPFADAQELDVPYVSTPHSVVKKMLNIADVGENDYVIDLGCGDGRIVVSAAQRGAYGHGVDLDPERIEEAEENAKISGVEDKVMFFQQDIFKTDFSRANIITMYLLNSINRRLRPILLDKLEPGTKIVSHNFDMGDWKPDKRVRIDDQDFRKDTGISDRSIGSDEEDFTLEKRMIEENPTIDTSKFDLSDWMIQNDIKLDNIDIRLEEQKLREPLSIHTHSVYLWIIPAKVEGRWQWQSNGKRFTMTVEQEYQEINLTLHAGNMDLRINESNLKGERIAFTAVNPSSGTKYVFNGSVDEDQIKGKVQVRGNTQKSVENWSASKR